MFKRNEKILFVLLAVLLTIVLLFSACGTETKELGQSPENIENSNKMPEKKTDETPVEQPKLEFTWYVHYDWATYMKDWGQGPISQWIEENKNVKAHWIMSGGAAKQKLSTMIVSNELPDVITIDRGPELDSLVKAGLLVPFDDYFEKYPNFQKWGGRKLVNMLRSSIDGKWYGMPSWYTNEKYPLGNAGWIVNTKYYSALGEPPLGTFDDLYAYLNTVKESYSDIQPLSIANNLATVYAGFAEGCVTDLYNMGIYVENGELKSLLDDPAYKEFVLFANKLYREGLLGGDDFAIRSEQLDEKFTNGKIAVACVGDALGSSATRHKAYKENDPEGGYKVIYAPIKSGLNRDRVKTCSYSVVGWNVTCITKAAKEPERIYEFLDWLTGEEGQAVSLYGPQGMYWDEWTTVDGVRVPNLDTPEYHKKNEEEFNAMKDSWHFNWVPNGAWQYVESMYKEKLFPPKEGEWKNIEYAMITRSAAVASDEFSNIIPDPTSPEGIAYSSIKEIINKQTVKAILASSEQEAQSAIDEAVQQLNQLGYDKVLKVMTENWKKRVELINQ